MTAMISAIQKFNYPQVTTYNLNNLVFRELQNSTQVLNSARNGMIH